MGVKILGKKGKKKKSVNLLLVFGEYGNLQNDTKCCNFRNTSADFWITGPDISS